MAMIIAILTLFVIMLLITAAVAVAVQTDSSSRQDAYRKNASEAAEAGLQIAVYRLNMLHPSSQNCVGDTASAPGSNGVCQSSTYTLGNGSTYQYNMTPALGPTANCVGLQITSTDVNQRCITAVGTSNGVTQRAQIRSAAFAAQPLFPANGIIGLNSVTMSGQALVIGTDATNGVASLSGQARATGTVLGPGGSYTHSGQASGGVVTTLSSPIVLSPVNPGTSNQSSLANCPLRQAAGYPACNDDYRITNGLASPKVAPYDLSQGTGVSWTASTRTLSLSGQASLTLGGGLYNFCSLSMSGQARITISATIQTEIFIDSPDDPGSGCAAGSGDLSMSGQANWNNQSTNPLNLQLYVYGRNNGTAQISLTGQANFYGVLYAPQSNVFLSGQGLVVGAVASRTASISGQGFNFDSRVTTLQATSNGLYYRTAWAQCSPTPPSGSTPQAGCG
ncbi:MAG TPA: hypothetical protein VGY32_01750 [Solirubrobacteraceae bacterium]|nr:hypothetical protein [Solirubrobacteraceae bacterium]